jgi:hypothetical protein
MTKPNFRNQNLESWPTKYVKEEDVVVITWILNMQKCGLFLMLEQLKMNGGKTYLNLI